MAYTLKEAAEAMGVSVLTIRRYIKRGKVKARLVDAKFGKSYIIDEIPQALLKGSMPTEQSTGYSGLITRLEQLAQESGYWRARAELAEQRLLLLSGGKRKSWWQRLFRGQKV